MAKVITDAQSMVTAGGVIKKVVEIRCDSLSDITPPDPTWCLGSLAAVAEEHSVFMLKSDGTWKNMDP